MNRTWIMLAGLVLVFGLVACQQPVEEKAVPEKKTPVVEKKTEEKTGEGEHEAPEGEEVAMPSPEIAAGKALFNDVKLGTVDKSCNSCHEAGQGLAGVAAKYTEEGALTGVINKCVEDTLKGKPLDKDSEQMKNLTAYISSLHK